jgi:glycosyltransferase involved in cell wall biosynthesis
MPIDVSVVIPTYNTGPKLEPLLASLAEQSLAADRYEVVVVDDGSTDDTWARLQGHAARMPNLVIERIPNSGWPGRPRNVGTDLARGRYVFYCDHDDGFFPEALERMVAFADRSEADLVIAKEVRSGALGIGAELFVANRDRADLLGDDVLAIITPHKLFRTSFLREQGIRYLEGRRRLEDHVFLAEVYTRTDRIAVLSSYPCYRWMIYADGSNNSSSLGDLGVYFDSLADVFTVLENADVPREKKDALILFWYSTRMLQKLWGYWFEDWEDAYRDEAIRVIGELAAKRVPAQLDHRLEPLERRRADLLRRGDHATIIALAEVDHRVRLRVDASSVAWTDAGLRVHLSGTLVDRHDEPLRLDSVDGGLFWRNDPDRAYDLRPSLDRATVDLFVRQHKVGTEWYALQPAPMTATATADGVVVEVSASFVLDPTSLVFGDALDDGPWSIYVHARGLGYSSRRRLSDDASAGAILDGLPVVVSPNHKGQTILSVGTTPRLFRVAVGSASVSGTGAQARIEVELPGVHVRGPGSARFGLRVGTIEVPAELVPGEPPRLAAELSVPRGSHDVCVVHSGRASAPVLTLQAGAPRRPVRTGSSLPGRFVERLRRLSS